MNKKNLKVNCCDGIYKSLDIHFTKKCENKCSFCIDKNTISLNNGIPNWREMALTIIKKKHSFNDILILGGEPCLFLKELNLFIDAIQMNTDLKIYLTSSIPRNCYINFDLFEKILSKIDGLNLSIQHHDEKIADKIRGRKSKFNRQKFYKYLPFKNKIRINLNLIKGFLDSREILNECLQYYDKMKFNCIKISELQNSPENYISFEKIYNVKLPSPYYYGCQTLFDSSRIIFKLNLDTPILLKRSCFVVEPTLKASFLDGFKVIYNKYFNKIKDSNFGVVYPDGSLKSGWINVLDFPCT